MTLMDKNNQPADGTSFPTISIPPSPDESGKQMGFYRLIRKLGEGGWGIVYLAEQDQPIKRQVALKLIKRGMESKQVLARFEAERQALAVLDSPYIAHVYDAGMTEDDRPYFAMEYIEGVKVTDYCDHHKFTIKERLELFVKVCEGIQHAHQKGIIHRDIKPSNILVSIQDERGIPKIIDFGVAKALYQPLTEKTVYTEEGQLIGTPEYMSPEQAQISQENVDIRTDVYSLGVLLYELLTGALPFDRKTLRLAAFYEVLRIIREQDPPRPSAKLTTLGPEAVTIAQNRKLAIHALKHTLNKELEWIPLKAIRKEPSHRYQTALEFINDIQNYLAGEPLSAGPESLGYRTHKYIQRNKVIVSSAVAVFTILIIGIIISSVFAIGQSKARKQAEITAYINRITAANSMFKSAYSNLDFLEIHELLNECPQDLRGWEWYHLWHVSNLSDKIFHGHTDRVTSVQFSPDGKRLISADRKGGIIIWNVNTGLDLLKIQISTLDTLGLSENSEKLQSQFTLRHPEDDEQKVVNCITASFSHDGSLFSAATFEETISIRNTDTGLEIMNLKGHAGLVNIIAFSPDGMYLASGDLLGAVKLWNLKSGHELLEFRPHPHMILDMCFSSDSKFIATLGCEPDEESLVIDFSETGSRFKVWSIADVNEPVYSSRLLFSNSIKFSPDNKQIASSGAIAGLWDIEKEGTGLPIVGGAMEFMAFLATDFRNKKERWLYDYFGDSAIYYSDSIAFSPDGSELIGHVYLDDNEINKINIWNTKTGENIFAIMNSVGLVPNINLAMETFFSSSAISISPDKQKIALIDNDPNAVRIYGYPNLDHAQVLSPVSSEFFKISPNGKYAAYKSRNHIGLTNVDSKKLLLTKDYKSWSAGLEYFCRDLFCFSPDNGKFVYPEESDLINVLDMNSLESYLLKGHTGKIKCIKYSLDGTKLASGGDDNTIKLWDVSSSSELLTMVAHTDSIESLVFIPNSEILISSSQDKTIKMWNFNSGKLIRSIPCPKGIAELLLLNKAGDRLMSFGYHSPAILWEVSTGREIKTFNGYGFREVDKIKFSPDGTKIVSVNKGMIEFWDSGTGQKLKQLFLHDQLTRFLKEEIYLNDPDSLEMALAFSPDGKRIIAGQEGISNKLTIWDIESGNRIASFETDLKVGEYGYIESIDFCETGKRIFCVHSRRGISVWDSTPKTSEMNADLLE